jgi:Transposase DDE domain
LITAVEVAPANQQDGPQAGALLDSQPAERRPQRVLGDTAYGTGPVRAELAERELEVLAPVPEAPVPEGRLAKRDLAIDPEAGTVTCPAGQVAKIHTQPLGCSRRHLRAPLVATVRCGPAASVPAPPTGACGWPPEEELLIAARQALDDPYTAEHLRRSRPRIERLLGLLVHRYGARKARYIGAAKARLQALWSAALVNLNPIARHLVAEAT